MWTPLIIAVVAAGVAAALAAAAARRRSQRVVAAARHDAERIVGEARQGADLVRRESEVAGRDAGAAIRSKAQADEASISEEIRVLAELIERKEGRAEQRAQQLEARGAALGERGAAVRARKDEAREVRDKVREAGEACERVIEQQAELTRAEVAEMLAGGLVEETRSQCADRLRNLEAAGAEEFARQAKRVMGIVMQRYTGHCVRERAAMTMALPEGAAAKLRGTAAREVDRLGEATRVRLLIADDGSSVRLESGDGVAREICRRALPRLIDETPVPDAEQLAATLKAELDRELRRVGRAAFRALRLKDAGDEVLDLMGRLSFRTSYTQNQYRHAIEAGHLAGMIAAELGMDPVLARRSALLHDLAKALTHEVDGSHALIGAEVARRGGESEIVVNAIAHHHGEVPSISAYAPLVAGVDAMSGGRPGARREMVESYGDRIGDLEKIAGGFPGVIRVHAMQAGREVRVHVDENRVGEDELQEISTAIAAKISEEMTFPGQIRVTVIREFCAIEYAS